MKTLLFFSFLSFSLTSVAQTFSVSVGTQACEIKNQIQICDRTIYHEQKVDLSQLELYQKSFQATAHVIPFEFSTTVIIRQRPKGYICRIFLKGAKDNKPLGHLAMDFTDITELTDIKLGSSQIDVTPTQSYFGWIKLSRNLSRH